MTIEQLQAEAYHKIKDIADLSIIQLNHHNPITKEFVGTEYKLTIKDITTIDTYYDNSVWLSISKEDYEFFKYIGIRDNGVGDVE